MVAGAGVQLGLASELYQSSQGIGRFSKQRAVCGQFTHGLLCVLRFYFFGLPRTTGVSSALPHSPQLL